MSRAIKENELTVTIKRLENSIYIENLCVQTKIMSFK